MCRGFRLGNYGVAIEFFAMYLMFTDYLRLRNIVPEIKLSLQLGYFVTLTIRKAEYPKYRFSSRQKLM